MLYYTCMTDTKKNVLKAFLVTFYALVITALIILGAIGAYGIFFMTPWQRKDMIEHYSDDSKYVTFTGKITGVAGPWSEEEKRCWMVKISVLSSEIDSFPGDRYSDGYLVPLTTYEELQANGFPWEDEETEYLFTSALGYWWDGFHYPLISVTSLDGETIYLSFEDGKHNYLDYVENIME